ncbi:MAG: RHS repeat protein [Hyphomonadaceae bacterium]|nr:RHS repeat protein [Hyphomonadaceae bacterium]
MTFSRRMLLMSAGAVCVFAHSLRKSALANDNAEYFYDELGRLIRVELSDGTIVVYAYDAAGNRIRVIHGDDVPFNTTIQVTGTGPVNLRTLADQAGYTGVTNATITFQVGSAVTITGASGAGMGIDTGTWPSATKSISLTLQVSGKVYGGGGNGGQGAGSNGDASTGGTGGDAIYCRENLSVTVNAGGQVKSGGGGGGGGGGWRNTIMIEGFPEISHRNGGGGGGGFPNGAGGPEGDYSGDYDFDVANPGNGGTTTGGGTGGSGGAGGGARTTGAGGAGGGAAATGSAGVAATGTQDGTHIKLSNASGGAAGYAVRKNGKTVTVTNNGTITGTVG